MDNQNGIQYGEPGKSSWLSRCAVLSVLVPLFWLVFSASTIAAEAKSEKINLFGTVEFRRPMDSLTQWMEMLARNNANPIFYPESRLNASYTWEKLKAELEKLSPLDQLKFVNNFWNRWPYREDPEAYGKPDYWAAPYEFLKNSGDCEDYSIVKYFTLRELGWPVERMRVVVVMESVRNIAHAVLIVYHDGDAYVLDNLSSTVISHSRYRNYIPQYSVNEKNRWAHVQPKKK